MQIRRATIADMDEIAQLYRDTILTVNSKDYTKEQIEAWASTYDNQEGWVRRMEEQFFYIAKIENKIVGFASIDKFGYLDLLYVHKDYQKLGIAKKLEAKLEEVARENEVAEISVQSSITAKPFFEHQDYKVTGEKHKLVNNVAFINTIMVKKLI